MAPAIKLSHVLGLFCLKLETYWSSSVMDLLVCTLFGSELATEITLAGLKQFTVKKELSY